MEETFSINNNVIVNQDLKLEDGRKINIKGISIRLNFSNVQIKTAKEIE